MHPERENSGYTYDNALSRCDSLSGAHDNEYTYYNDAQFSGSTIDYFLINAMNIVSS